MYEIKTADYIKTFKIIVDGKEWTVKRFGAGYELSLSQATRRLKLLGKKIENDTAIDEDYDQYDKLEQKVTSIFSDIFNDGTENNTSVKKWVEETPSDVLMKIFQDVTKQLYETKVEDDRKELPKT